MGKYGEMKKAGDWVGKTVVLKTAIENRMLFLPVGTECKVTYAYRGLTLQSAPCSKCGVSIFIRGVPYVDIREKIVDEKCKFATNKNECIHPCVPYKGMGCHKQNCPDPRFQYNKDYWKEHGGGMNA